MESKKHILKIRAVDREVFDLIANRRKKIETRAGNKIYDQFQVGDILVFKCGKDTLEKKITERKHFNSVSALFNDYLPKQIMPSVNSKEELEEKYKSYPNYTKRIKENGLLAWELE